MILTNCDFSNYRFVSVQCNSWSKTSHEISTRELNYSPHFLVSDSLQELIFEITQPILAKGNIKSGNKIYISQDVDFPALLLSRGNLNISRTSKLDKSDTIICNFDSFSLAPPERLSNYLTKVAIDNQNQIVYFQNVESKLFESFIAQSRISNIKHCARFREDYFNNYLFYQKYSDKIVSKREFVNYYLNQLEKITSEDLNELLNIISSENTQSVITGIQTLQYFDYRDNISQILKFLNQSSVKIKERMFSNKSVAWKLFHYILGLSPSDLFGRSYFNNICFYDIYDKIKKYSLISNNDMENIRKLALEQLEDKIYHEYLTYFDAFKCKPQIIDDPNRETTGGN